MGGSSPSGTVRELAERLLACEAARENRAGAGTPAVLLVAEKLRHSLSKLAGEAGYRALLARALTLAKAQAPGLSAVQLQPGGSLEGFDDHKNGEGADADAVLITQLLGLLVTFVGDSLTRRLVQDAWPDLPGEDTGSENAQSR